jgi:hypothetical protein
MGLSRDQQKYPLVTLVPRSHCLVQGETRVALREKAALIVTDAKNSSYPNGVQPDRELHSATVSTRHPRFDASSRVRLADP